MRTLLILVLVAISSCSSNNHLDPNHSKAIVNSFPKGYFIEPPHFTFDRDTLNAEMIIYHKDWHTAHYYAIDNQVRKKIDDFASSASVDNIKKNGIYYHVYNTERDTNLLAEFHSVYQSLSSIGYDSLQNIYNSFILKSDPRELNKMDELIDMYSNKYNLGPKTNVLELYLAACGDRKLENSDLLLMDSLKAGAARNYEFIDTSFVNTFDYYINLIYNSNSRELVIEEQVPDRLKR